ncbi:MAG TPA: hypothetical protein VLA15_07460, partial [Desulfurivibrionaceae bacterium]|nr:hypothetical protein [Desulfurivibrionaceae bacterium]
MQEKSFLAKYLTLIVGVSLPLLLVFIFWVAMAVPRMTVDDPQYDLVLASRYYVEGARQLNGTLAFDVVDGQLVARFTEDPNFARTRGNALANVYPAPRLYYFASAGGNLREIDYGLPDEPEDGAIIPVAALAGRTLVAESTAPDGYRFDNSYRGSRGFLFLFDGYRYGAKIEKDGRAVKIPAIDGN